MLRRVSNLDSPLSLSGTFRIAREIINCSLESFLLFLFQVLHLIDPTTLACAGAASCRALTARGMSIGAEREAQSAGADVALAVSWLTSFATARQSEALPVRSWCGLDRLKC